MEIIQIVTLKYDIFCNIITVIYNKKRQTNRKIGTQSSGSKVKTMMAELPKIVVILGGHNVINLSDEEELKLDMEWVELIKEALELGLSFDEMFDEIRDFLAVKKTRSFK